MQHTVPVVVTDPEYQKAKEVFASASADGLRCIPAPPEEAPLAEALLSSGARYAIVGVDRYVGALYEALPAGGAIARFGVGYDGLDLACATQRGILCTNTPGVPDRSVAEHALALILCAARHLQRSREWRPEMGVELHTKQLAVIGCGAIGCNVARMASNGFGMRVAGCEIREVDADKMKIEHGFESVTDSFEAAVAEAKFVSLHLPCTQKTRGFLDRTRLAMLPNDAWLINTARGGLLDEIALFEALSEDRLGGAALDVFCTEPYAPIDSAKDLRSLPNVVMTSHVGSSTVEACQRMAARALLNVRRCEAGDFQRMDLINPDALPIVRKLVHPPSATP